MSYIHYRYCIGFLDVLFQYMYCIAHSGKKRYVNRGSGESVPCLSRRRRRGGFLRLLTFALDALPVTLPVTRGRATAVLSTSARGDGQSATASPGPSTRIARACPHCPLQTAVQIFSCCLLSGHLHLTSHRHPTSLMRQVSSQALLLRPACGDIGIYHDNAEAQS